MSRRVLLIALAGVGMAVVLAVIVQGLRAPAPQLLEIPPVIPVKPSSSAWQALFNGQDLAGWQHLGGGRVAVEHGHLVLEHDAEHRPGYLVSEVTVRDFAVRFRCQVQKGDSGVFYRSRRDPHSPASILGPQVQLNIDAESHLGGIYETQGRGWVARPAELPLRTDEAGVRAWLDGEVSAWGEHIKVVLDGATVVDFEDAPATNAFREAGFFALQIHGGGECRVLFERIEVRILD